MTISAAITAINMTAAIIWTVAGAVELAAGHHSRAAAYAGVEVFALVIEMAWRVLRPARR